MWGAGDTCLDYKVKGHIDELVVGVSFLLFMFNLLQLSNKDVVNNYSTYVNNFTMAMTTLEIAINKKPKFVQFLKEKYVVSRTSLSLQGLLLKPIQRFPQYILFLQVILYLSTFK